MLDQWCKDNHGPWDAAIAGSSALRAALLQMLRDEVAFLNEEVIAKILWDVEKFYGTGIAGQFLNELVAAMKGTKWYNNTDAQIDYFDIAYYVYINIGQWDKEYKVVEAA